MNWGFAKGHVEKGETEVETALREVKEETNLDVEILPYFKEQVYFFMRKTKKQVIFFLAKAKPGQKMKLQESEILDATWATYQEAKRLLKFTNTKQMLEKAYIHILKNE
jgi:8-oxo-dGTP pyrophosphatase MutT (NUDIX family)